MKLKLMVQAAALSAALIASSVAFAEGKATQTAYYADAKVGYGYVNSNPKTSAGVRKESVKRKGAAWGIDGGYMFMNRLGVEVGYQDFADVRYTGGKETKMHALYLAAKGFMAISNGLDIYGKLGLARSSQTNPTGNLDAGKHNKTVPYVALGLQGAINDNLVWLVDASYYARVKPVAAKYAVSAGVGFDF